MKQCSKCKQWKGDDKFYNDKRLKSGKRSDCIECCSNRKKEYAHTEHGKEIIRNWWKSEKGQDALKRNNRNPEKVEKIKKYLKTDKGKEVHKKSSAKYRNTHREKTDAHNAIRTAKKKGDILPASKYICSMCKQRQASHYHHDDYSRPLDVKPLCYKCHNSLRTS